MKKDIILLVYHGTTNQDIADKTFTPLNQKVSDLFDTFEIKIAYSSMIIRKRLMEKGVRARSPEEILDSIDYAVINKVYVQTLNIVDGILNSRLKQKYVQNTQIVFSLPLLYSIKDYEETIHAIESHIDIQNKNVCNLFIGHGSDHPSTASYTMLEYYFYSLGYSNCLVGTFEGYPTFENILEKLKKMEIDSIKLIPFVFMSGFHVAKDIKEWQKILESKGYKVDLIDKGLGEYDKIQDIFINHLCKFVKN